MILLKKVRLINWYAFSNETVPVGFFTLIAGKNGNGKSVMLDAIKYAAYGDTVFNKSSENRGSRTLSSYTRGLLDATAKTYMRPADKAPNVYSHIVLEYHDDVLEKSFLLGTILETGVSNNIQSYRYVMDQTALEDVEHLDEEDKPYDARRFQKKYGVTLLNKEMGIGKFMQMTGLKLTSAQTATYLRKLRGIMSYDPDAKIDQFIRESVLEHKPIDFTKLIEAKENIERLKGTFDAIQTEIADLEKILEQFEGRESQKNLLLIDDIKIVYKSLKDLNIEIDRMQQDKRLAESRKDEAKRLLASVMEREEEQQKKLREVENSLDQMDCMKLIRQTEEELAELEKEKKQLQAEKAVLDSFQTQVSEMMHALLEAKYEISEKRILASLTSGEYTPSEKEEAVLRLKEQITLAYEDAVGSLSELGIKKKEIEKKIGAQTEILDSCKKNRNAYQQIHDYTKLKEEINREFAARGIASEAKFACEYVIGLTEEKWRNAVEAFLGRRRYTILVEPEYYDIADDVLNSSQNKRAHLFNTKLLMKKRVTPLEDSAAQFLVIKNPVARKYFDYQLGHMRAVALDEVKNYENAISAEGRVAVAMDGYFLRFEQISYYYLGQETFALNQKRAEREIERLQKEKMELLGLEDQKRAEKERLKMDRELFKSYRYDAYQAYQMAADQERTAAKNLKKLKDAQKNNREFVELNQLRGLLEEELAATRREKTELFDVKSKMNSQIDILAKTLTAKTEKFAENQKQFEEYELTQYGAVQKATQAYERFLENGEKGAGGLLAALSRRRVGERIAAYEREILVQQGLYNGKRTEESHLPVGLEQRNAYEARKAKIWMDDLQEIKEKLAEQTRRYENIFKNEFVLTILRSCNKAIDDLKAMNQELARLKFSAKYQFDVHFVKDMSDYARIIEYAKYLNEREQFGGGNGQMLLGIFNSYQPEEEERLENDIKDIINHMIAKNNIESIERFADYRNYMTYEILITNQILDHAKLSRQTGFNSGAEVQIPYLLILLSALLMIYNEKVNSTRLIFIDEPFAKMDPGNVKLMLEFMRNQNLQVIFCAPDKTETIGNESEVILPVLRLRADSMRLGVVQFHDAKRYVRKV